jgi:hypothetical protein
MITYPEPPWHTHGRAYMSSYVVRASELRVPAPLEIESYLGRTLGVLAYVIYETPSPLTYGELVWMPCRVKVRTHDGRVLRGFYVDKMYVDLEASLRAGREIWGLPKQLARFEELDGRVRISTEDGAELDLDVGARAGVVKAHSKASTLQVRDGDVIRFVGDTTRANTSAGYARVRSATGTQSFQGFANAKRMPGAGVALVPFATTMCPPEPVRVR